MHANHNGRDALYDALLAGLAAALGPLGVSYASGALPTAIVAYGAFLAFLGAFLGSLIVARRRTEP